MNYFVYLSAEFMEKENGKYLLGYGGRDGHEYIQQGPKGPEKMPGPHYFGCQCKFCLRSFRQSALAGVPGKTFTVVFMRTRPALRRNFLGLFPDRYFKNARHPSCC